MLVIAGVIFAGLPVILVVVLAIIATCFSAFFSPAIGAYLPSFGPVTNRAWARRIAPGRASTTSPFSLDRPWPAVILGIFNSIAFAFLLDAVTFALRRGDPVPAPARAPSPVAAEDSATADSPPAERTAESQRDVYATIRRPLAGSSSSTSSTGFVFGGLGVMTVVLATEHLTRPGEAGTGLLNSAIGIGGVVGALIAGVLVLRRRLGPPLMVGAVLMMVGLIALGQAQLFALALAAIALAAGIVAVARDHLDDAAPAHRAR